MCKNDIHAFISAVINDVADNPEQMTVDKIIYSYEFEKDNNDNYIVLIIESTEELTMQARMIYRKKVCNGIYRDYDFESTKRSLMDGKFGELALFYCEQSEIIRQAMR